MMLWSFVTWMKTFVVVICNEVLNIEYGSRPLILQFACIQ
jgi:hypothetical protein